MSAADYLDEWFESEALKGDQVGERDHRHAPRAALARTAYVLLHHYMGELDGVFRAWGFAKGGNGVGERGDRAAARAAGAEIRTDAPVAQRARRERPRDRRGAREAARRSGPASWSRTPIRGARSSSWSGEKHLPGEFVDGDSPLPLPRRVGAR